MTQASQINQGNGFLINKKVVINFIRKVRNYSDFMKLTLNSMKSYEFSINVS